MFSFKYSRKEIPTSNRAQSDTTLKKSDLLYIDSMSGAYIIIYSSTYHIGIKELAASIDRYKNWECKLKLSTQVVLT